MPAYRKTLEQTPGQTQHTAKQDFCEHIPASLAEHERLNSEETETTMMHSQTPHMTA